MSKGAKGDKSLRKIQNKEKIGEDVKKNPIGALEINKHFFTMFEGKKEVCKILECRLVQNTPENLRQPSNYEYYVTFIALNRRNDKWIQFQDILKDENNEIDEILKGREEEEKKKETNPSVNPFENDEHEGLDKNCILQHNEATKVKTINQISFGKFKCDTWYFSPYPEGYHEIPILYICEFCLNFYTDENELKRHMDICTLRHPPGNEIYRDGDISMFEVDGKLEQIYCENLCYMAKLFLDHKTLQWDADPFLFYILCKYDEMGYHFVGYFSKEKESNQGYNVACILTMPFYQRQGFGKFLIDFSYLLSKKEQKVGTPEKPLSDLGYSTYFSYWTQALCDAIKECKDPVITIDKLASMTAIKHSDICKVLGELELLVSHEGQYIIIADPVILDEISRRAGRKGYPLRPEKLVWTPFKYRYDI